MEESKFVLPGETIPRDQLPISSNPKHALKLGPGLRHMPPSDITSVSAGELTTDTKKHAAWLSRPSKVYFPVVGDLVIAQVVRSAGEAFYCSLAPYTANATLPHLSFQNATKKTRPQLPTGSLVYARVALANKYFDPEIECVSSTTNKAEGLGELKGGMIYNVSLDFARRLMMGDGKGGVVVLDECSERVPFEVAIGRNGIVWIDSEGPKSTILIGKALQESDQKGLDPAEQRALVKSLLKAL